MANDNKLEVKSEVKSEGYLDEEELCRFCAEKSNQYYSVFNENLHESLTSYLGVSIQESDNWPKSICKKCLEAAKISLDFISTIRRAESTLRGLFGDLGETIDMKPDIEMINVKDTPQESESEDNISDQETHGLSNCDELEISIVEHLKKKRGRPRKSPKNDSVKPSVIQTRSRRSKRTPQRSPLDKNKTSSEKVIKHPSEAPKVTRRSASELEEEDERIRNFFKLQCNICADSFDKFRGFNSHCQKVHQEEAFVMCCDKKLNSRAKLVAHLNYHTNPNAYKCTKCEKTFLTNHGLQLHELNNHVPPEEHKFQCPDCPRTFMTLYRLKGHRLSHLTEEEKKFKCPQCEKSFALNSILRQHIRHFHEGSNKHICEVCAKEFRSKYTYQLHMNNHFESGVGKYLCKMCGKLFKRQRLLQLHIERHNESGQIFKCDLCGKEAPNRFALKRHIQYSHEKVRKHKCNLCSSAFKTPISLREHMATHTSSQILYTCLFCPKQFNSNANKYVHQKRKHPVEYEAMKQKNSQGRA